MRFTRLLPALAFVALSVPYAAAAEDPQVTRLAAAQKTQTWNAVPAGKTARYGHAEALVGASADKVNAIVSDFHQLASLHKKFASARVVGGQPGAYIDIFMRYPVYVGPITMHFDETIRVGPPVQRGNAKVYEGVALKGDMKEGSTLVTVKPVDDAHCIVEMDILFVPKISAPQGLVDKELREGAENYVSGLKARAERP